MEDGKLDAFVVKLQHLCAEHGVALHGCRIQQHDQVQLGFTVSHGPNVRYFHWIAPAMTQEDQRSSAE